LGCGCFFDCTRLSSVTFEAGSKLSRIHRIAFQWCSSLSSICIPSSVLRIGEGCFARCPALSNLTLESDSRLLRFVQRSELFLAFIADELAN
jgi:hypothetical protein